MREASQNLATLANRVIPHIRWMIRCDMPEVLDIEQRCFPQPWDEDAFISHLRQRTIIGMVCVVDDERVPAFMVYRLHNCKFEILNFAVHPDWQHKGLGTAMVARLKDRLSFERRRQIILRTSERNLGSQLFWQAQGFKATRIIQQEGDADAIEMRYTFKPEGDV